MSKQIGTLGFVPTIEVGGKYDRISLANDSNLVILQAQIVPLAYSSFVQPTRNNTAAFVVPGSTKVTFYAWEATLLSECNTSSEIGNLGYSTSGADVGQGAAHPGGEPADSEYYGQGSTTGGGTLSRIGVGRPNDQSANILTEGMDAFQGGLLPRYELLVGESIFIYIGPNITSGNITIYGVKESI